MTDDRSARPAQRRGVRAGARGQPTPIGGILESVVQAIAPPTHVIDVGSHEARARRSVRRELERQIGRAVWRAERRSRRMPRHVRESASWVMKQRRRLAYELARALGTLGCGRLLAYELAERACVRFPRNGVVIPDEQLRADRPEADARRRPRLAGTAPRQQGTNPRAAGTNPRAVGRSPRQQREQRERLAPADLSHQPSVTRAVLELESPGQTL